MKLVSSERPAAEIEPPSHPNAGEPWFQSLPPERRLEMTLRHRSDLRRMQELLDIEKRRMVLESLRMGAVFGAGDLISPGGGLASAVLAFLVGTLAGFLLNRLDAKRVLSAVVGGGSFFVLECVLRGGMSGLHMFLCYPLTAACALIGWVREERGT